MLTYKPVNNNDDCDQISVYDGDKRLGSLFDAAHGWSYIGAQDHCTCPELVTSYMHTAHAAPCPQSTPAVRQCGFHSMLAAGNSLKSALLADVR